MSRINTTYRDPMTGIVTPVRGEVIGAGHVVTSDGPLAILTVRLDEKGAAAGEDRAKPHLTPKERLIFKHIKSKIGNRVSVVLRNRDIAGATSTHETYVPRLIKNLIEKGMIERTGNAHKWIYKIINASQSRALTPIQDVPAPVAPRQTRTLALAPPVDADRPDPERQGMTPKQRKCLKCETVFTNREHENYFRCEPCRNKDDQFGD
jgi:hypothetical protein